MVLNNVYHPDQVLGIFEGTNIPLKGRKSEIRRLCEDAAIKEDATQACLSHLRDRDSNDQFLLIAQIGVKDDDAFAWLPEECGNEFYFMRNKKYPDIFLQAGRKNGDASSAVFAGKYDPTIKDHYLWEFCRSLPRRR